MNFKIKLILCGLVLGHFIYGQDIEYARDIVKHLSSEKFHGRGYVKDGVAIAAGYIEKEFNHLGIKEIHTQKFSVPVNSFPGDMSVHINGKPLNAGVDFLIDPSSPSLEISGIPLLLPINALKDTTRLYQLMPGLKNKIVVADIRDVETSVIEIGLEKLKHDPTIEHKALVLITNKKLIWGVSPVQAEIPVITINAPVNIHGSDTLYIDIDAVYHPNYPVKNIIAFIEGNKSDSLLVFTAHYDHLGKMGEQTYFPGANDNASGVAMLLNLARYFSGNPPNHDMLFVAFAAEELGLFGSRFFVRHPPVSLSNIKFLINFDLAGTGDDGITVVNATKYPDYFSRLLHLNECLDLLPAVKERGEACNSDHCPFDLMDVPCFYIYTLGGIQAYHDIYDKYETLPLTEFEDYAKLIIEFVKSM